MYLAYHSATGVLLAPIKIAPKPPPPIKKGRCRFCAQEKLCTEMLDLVIKPNWETYNMLVNMLKFFKIDFVDLSNMKLPKTICTVCYHEVSRSYNFFLNIKESQKVLKELYCKVEKKNNRNDEPLIKPEPIEIEIQEVKQEPDTENNYFSQTTELKSTPEIKQELLVPMDKTPGSARAKKGKFKPKNKRNQSMTLTHTKVPRIENICTVIKMEVDDDDRNTQEDSKKRKKKKDLIEVKIENNITDQNSNSQNVTENTGDMSWTGYPWRCKHCQMKFDTMLDLRNHSMQLHKYCFAYDCVDCPNVFNTFYQFIEHVRRHRNELRLYCPHCNKQFSSEVDCTLHVLAYWSSGQKICNWCGEVCPNADALNEHKSSLYQVRLTKRWSLPRVVPSARDERQKTWEHYEWGCLECALSFRSVADLRAHSQSVHDKCFAMRCADCLEVKYDYPHFVKHVVNHRPYLKNYCQYCNQHFEDTNDLKKHIDDHFTSPQRPCYGCGQTFPNRDEETQHVGKFKPNRTEKYLTTEDLTCPICQKVSTTGPSLRWHMRIHDGNRKKEYCCHLCGKELCTKTSLQYHMLGHDQDRKYKCKVCNKGFLAESALKVHVTRHLEEKPYICDQCSKGYPLKHLLRKHIITKHNTSMLIKKYKCSVCPKTFVDSKTFKGHMNYHTGIKPYKCQNCDKSFTHWGNCNKHMIRMHGTTLATSRLTDRGKMPIGEEWEFSTNIKEWMEEVTKPKKREKKVKKEQL